jgi:hypothetical protein
VDYGTTSATSTATVWAKWTSSGAVSYGAVSYQDQYIIQPVKQTEEQLAAMAAAAEQRRIAEEERIAKAKREAEALRLRREAADKTAKALLDMFLTPAQQKTMNEIESIIVKAENEKWYRIRKGSSCNVDELDGENGKVVARLCVVPRWDYQVPVADQMLAQKLMLETNAAEFMRIANRFPVPQVQ